ncbi:MAG TPA: hypothetical protein VGF45_00615, partial [Polyangia bacterium]
TCRGVGSVQRFHPTFLADFGARFGSADIRPGVGVTGAIATARGGRREGRRDDHQTQQQKPPWHVSECTPRA